MDEMKRRRYMLEAEDGILGLRELCSVCHTMATPPLNIHTHPGAFEVCFLYKGLQTYSVMGRNYNLEGMDIFVTFPGESHSSGEYPEEKSELYYMILDTDSYADAFLGFARDETTWLALWLGHKLKRTFKGNDRLRELWDEAFYVYETQHPLRRILLRGAVLRLLLELLNCSEQLNNTSISPDIVMVKDYISAHIEEYMPVSQLADQCGLSLSRFKQKFREQMGMPPGEYIIRAKVDRAEALLRGGSSVTETAFQLSFSSSQHLAMTFRKLRGYPPSVLKPVHRS